MVSESIQKKCLDSILNSKEFAGSSIYKKFLTYLVKSTNEGKLLKEVTIAMEVFGKDASFNPAEDTIVRSHTYSLRKKLDSYYYNEGKDDKYRLRIPKGHYNVQFVPAHKNVITSKNAAIKLLKKYDILLILLLLGLLIWQTVGNITGKAELAAYEKIDQDDPIWFNYLQSELPILVLVGDHFFFNTYIDELQDTVVLRHTKINSFADLRTMYPDLKVNLQTEPYFPYHATWSLPPILKMLTLANKTPILRKASSITPQMLDEYDIIYVGSIKSLHQLVHTLLNSHFQFTLSPHSIIYNPPTLDSTYVYHTNLHSTGPNEDLVLALKLPGPDKNSIFIFASFHSLGAPEIVKYLTEETTRHNFEETYFKGTSPKYFEALFQVTGIDKTAYDTKVLVFNEITAE